MYSFHLQLVMATEFMPIELKQIGINYYGENTHMSERHIFKVVKR